MPHDPSQKAASKARPATARAAVILALLVGAVGALTIHPPAASAQQRGERTHRRTLKADQSVNALLGSLGVPGGQRLELDRALAPLIDLSRHARPGDTLEITLDARKTLVALIYQGRKGRFFVRRQGGRLLASRRPSQDLDRAAQDAQLDDEAPRPEPPEIPPWLVPNAADDLALSVRDYYKIKTKAERTAAAAALEESLGLDGLQALLRRAYAAPPRASGKHMATMTLADGAQLQYAIFVPDGYDPARPLPLHVSLHGKGGNGPGMCRLKWQEPQAGMLIACPDLPGGVWHTDQGKAAVEGLVRQLLRDYSVDPDRVILGGFSNGGIGTWHFGARMPWMWAGLTPRSGAMIERVKLRQNIPHMPIFITHGTRDGNIGVDHARQMVALLTEVGNPPRYIEIEGGGHDFFSHLNPEIVGWMLTLQRVQRRSFLFHPDHADAPEWIYWVRAQGTGTLEAEIADAPDHTLITIKTQNPPRLLEIAPPPGLIDPARPVRVVLNEVEIFSGEVRPGAEGLLETFGQTGDLSRATPRLLKLLPR